MLFRYETETCGRSASPQDPGQTSGSRWSGLAQWSLALWGTCQLQVGEEVGGEGEEAGGEGEQAGGEGEEAC